MEKINDSDEGLVTRASFMTDIAHESWLMSGFQLARDYSPSIIDLLEKFISESMLKTNHQTTTVREVKKIM